MLPVQQPQWQLHVQLDTILTKLAQRHLQSVIHVLPATSAQKVLLLITATCVVLVTTALRKVLLQLCIVALRATTSAK